jgi:hypothetical protein
MFATMAQQQTASTTRPTVAIAVGPASLSDGQLSGQSTPNLSPVSTSDTSDVPAWNYDTMPDTMKQKVSLHVRSMSRWRRQRHRNNMECSPSGRMSPAPQDQDRRKPRFSARNLSDIRW